jgi:hypothetical protein
MAPVEHEPLPATLLAREPIDPLGQLREDLEDALKEYRQFDLLVEVLQNAIDAIEARRWESLCAAADLDPEADTTIAAWDGAVLQRLDEDYTRFSACGDYAALALYYGECEDEAARRAAWWNALAARFHDLGATISADDLAAVSNAFRGTLRVRVEVGDPNWLTVEDDGVGIADIAAAFIHRSSAKRPSTTRPRRYGVRGSHGWGLTAVLALSDRVEVVSSAAASEARGYVFADYASFTRGDVDAPRNDRIDPASTHATEDLRTGDRRGAYVRVQVANPDEADVFGNTLRDFDHQKLETLLRLYTPVGQTNDYVFHPAYHTCRRNELRVLVESEADGVPHGPTSVAFDFFRMSGHPRPVHQTFREAVNDPRSGRSVHVVYRSRHGNVVLLGGADVQWTGLMRELETDLINANALPSYRPDKDAGEADTIDDLRALLPARAGDEFQASGPSKEVPNRKESA